MLIKATGILLAFCALSQAQDTPPQDITKVIRVHGNARLLATLAAAGAQATVVGDEHLQAVVVRGRPAIVAEIERNVHDLDAIDDSGKSIKNIEFQAYLIGGTLEAAASPDNTPELLAPVYKQLRAIFPYKSYQLLNTMLIRSAQGSPSRTSGMLKPFTQDFAIPGRYSIEYGSSTVTTDPAVSIHLERLKFGARIPVPSAPKPKEGAYASTAYQEGEVSVETNVDLREGQKVVIGTSNVEPAGTTLFLVVTARLVQ